MVPGNSVGCTLYACDEPDCASDEKRGARPRSDTESDTAHPSQDLSLNQDAFPPISFTLLRLPSNRSTDRSSNVVVIAAATGQPHARTTSRCRNVLPSTERVAVSATLNGSRTGQLIDIPALA
jgi:hypothetical protein